jgi:uncharacterized protein YbbC (DUF1343 family)
MKYLLLALSILFLACEKDTSPDTNASLVNTRTAPKRVFTGAEVLLKEDLASLSGKRVGLVGNHTSLVFGKTHLVDTLLASGVSLKKVFSPEHGFRGDADAGAKVASSTDPATGLPIVSLYGKNKKPRQEQLEGLDVLLFDIQDVGARFYTYISTLTYVMEACAEVGISVVVLDRPNPNGWYVDGPVLEKQYSSFIGMHEIPIVHGMTVGEYAQMINGEGWLAGGLRCDVLVIKAKNYTHAMRWEETGLDWVSPSPNLASVRAASWYPALCWFEPTPVSVGRGTDSAFTMIGAPWLLRKKAIEAPGTSAPEAINFTPRSLPGKSTYPKFENESCAGYYFNFVPKSPEKLFTQGIELFRQAYQDYGSKPSFFKKNFERWPGTASFRQQIESGLSAERIYQSWQLDVAKFKEVRKSYLLYEDF